MTAKPSTASSTSLMQALGTFSSELSFEEQRQFITTSAESSYEFTIWRELDNRIKFITASCFQLTGYAPEEFINNNHLLVERIHPDDLNTWQESHEKAQHGKIQVRFLRSTGEIIWFEHTCTGLFNDDNELLSFIGNFVDITERKKAEANNQKLAVAVEQSDYGVAITDANGAIEYLNPAFGKMNNETIAYAIGDLLPLLNHQSLQYKEITATLKTAEFWQEDRYESLGKWYLTRVAPIYNQTGKLINFAIGKVDISQRILDKQWVVEQHAELQSLFKQVETGKKEWERSLDCINDVVLLANSDGIVHRVNRAIKRMLNMEIADCLGQDWKAILPMEVAMQSPFPKEGQFYHSKLDKWLRYQIFNFSDHRIETTVEKIITLHDETEVREMNQNLSQAYEHLKSTQGQMLHQEKMASIGQLAAGVAHEINNPTGFITSNLTSLKKYTKRLINHINFLEQALAPLANQETQQQLQEQQKKIKLSFMQDDIDELIEESLEGTERIKAIVKNLKGFSRVDDTAIKKADLIECLDSALSIAWNEIKYNAKIVKEYQPIPEVCCSAQQLNQVFLNLLINAGQAIKEQGTITISTSLAEPWVVIKIADSGNGIAEENISRIFEPFYTTKEIGKGTGLGLSICHDIIKNHDGEISAESELGVGTTFTIKLPIDDNYIEGVDC